MNVIQFKERQNTLSWRHKGLGVPRNIFASATCVQDTAA